MLDIDGKRILVSGAGNGIGRALARILAQGGATVLLSDLKPCAQTAAEITDLGGRYEDHICNVADQAQVDRLAAAVGRIDSAVCAAGVTSFMGWDDADYDAELSRIIDVNLKGTIRMARALTPLLYRNKGGNLVLVGSVAAWTGGTLAGVGPHYASVKGAIHSLVRWLARDAAPHNVMVNGVAPGPTATAQTDGQDLGRLLSTPLKRLARPEEIAWPIAFLASPRASFITGTILDANGGIYMR